MFHSWAHYGCRHFPFLRRRLWFVEFTGCGWNEPIKRGIRRPRSRTLLSKFWQLSVKFGQVRYFLVFTSNLQGVNVYTRIGWDQQGVFSVYVGDKWCYTAISPKHSQCLHYYRLYQWSFQTLITCMMQHTGPTWYISMITSRTMYPGSWLMMPTL